MRQKNRDSQSLILNPLSLGHEHGLSVSTDQKRKKGVAFLLRPSSFIMTLPHTSPQRPACRASFITGHETIIHKESRPISYI